MNAVEITDVRPLAEHWLRLWFSDGAIVDVDAGPLIASGPVFAPIRAERAVFERVTVDSGTGTIAWPGDVDLCPEVLSGREEPASGVRFARRVVRAAPGAAI